MKKFDINKSFKFDDGDILGNNLKDKIVSIKVPWEHPTLKDDKYIKEFSWSVDVFYGFENIQSFPSYHAKKDDAENEYKRFIEWLKEK